MRNVISQLIVLSVVVSIPLPREVSAQASNSAATAITIASYAKEPARLDLGLADRSGAMRLQLSAADNERKDPMVAGVLSALVPGLGSFYADNSRHGAVHLGVNIAAYALMFGAIGSSTSCTTFSCVNSTANTVYIGYLGYLTNGVWSIFTAVNDARTFNGATAQKPGRIVGSLYLEPAVQVLRIEETSRGAVEHVGLQVARITF